MKNTILKSMLAMGIIAFAASMLAVSCGKVAGGGGNNNNANNSANNSGSGNSGGSGNDGGGGGNAGCTGICPTTNLNLLNSSGLSYVKISSNTITINAAGWSAASNPRSEASDTDRGFDDAEMAGNSVSAFTITYPGSIGGTSVGLYFVNRAHVTKDNITMPAATASCPSSESADTLLAIRTGGSLCMEYSAGRNQITFESYLGTVFNNTKTGSHARGSLYCQGNISKDLPSGGGKEAITDTTVFNASSGALCQIAMLNNAGTAATAEIDDAWVGDTASTTEVDLYAIGIDVTGKTISQFSSAPGYNLAEFIKAHDNAAFKKLLQNNKWGELKFKIKIVTAANF